MTPYEFLSIAWGGQTGFGFLCFKDKNAWEGMKHWKDFPVKLPVSEAVIEEAIATYPPEDYDWYFSPETFSQPKRQVRFAQDTDLLWSDVDDGDINRLDKKPFLYWTTSKGRFAALWKQDIRVPVEVAVATNSYIAKRIKADPSGSDTTQVLRVVGTINHKPDKGDRVKLISCSPLKYDFREETIRGLFLSYKVPEKVKEALATNVTDESDRSQKMYYACRAMFEAKMTLEQVREVLRYSKWNKFGDNPKRFDDELTREWKKFNASKMSEIDREEEMEGLEAFDLLGIEAEELDFLWDPYIPEGKITIIEGDPGLGKSWLTMKIAADLSCGRALPGSDPQEPRKVLLLSAEDGLADTIKPRLELMDANFKNIFAVNKPVYITEPDMRRIRTICIDKNISVIIIDPLVAFMGGKVDLHKANQTRDIMARLARLGDELGVTIICIRHLTKGGKDKAIYRGLGSIDITGAARSVLAIGRDPSNPYSGRVICHIKSNLAREGLSLLYYLDDRAEPFRWGEFTDDRAQDILAVDLQGHSREGPRTEPVESPQEMGIDEATDFSKTPGFAHRKPKPPQREDTKGYSRWAREVRKAISKATKPGEVQALLEEALEGAPEDVKEKLRQKYFNY